MVDEEAVSVTWWLDSSALPDLFWARLRHMPDGKAEVLTNDGVCRQFGSVEDADIWLSEDEYSRYVDLLWAKSVPLSIKPPNGANGEELVRKMTVRRRSSGFHS